eukprot:SAG31_NODE_7316_length_1721_cov_2.074599_2_plen_323_part_01
MLLLLSGVCGCMVISVAAPQSGRSIVIVPSRAGSSSIGRGSSSTASINSSAATISNSISTAVSAATTATADGIHGHVRYFGMWGDDPAPGPDSTAPFTNLHLPYGCHKWLCTVSELPAGMLTLLPLRWLLLNCTHHNQTNGGLKTDWRELWAGASQHYAPMIANGSAVGFMLGDEIVSSGCTCEAVALMAQAVRDDFPDVPIYYNENVPTVQEPYFTLPPALSWFSFDYYHYDGNDTGAHVKAVRDMYEKHVYPKMLPHQKLLLVPGAFAMPVGSKNPDCTWKPNCRKTPCDLACYDEMGADDAAHYWQWAQNDTRVIGLAPW